MKKQFFINEPIIEAKDFIQKNSKETHPHEIPISLGVEYEQIITSHFSFVIDTIKNKNHKLEKMVEEGKLDVTFIRVDTNGVVKWYFEDHKTPRLTDRLTKELEEKTSVYIRPWTQKSGRGYRSEQIKSWVVMDDIEGKNTPTGGLMALPWQEPRERKESEQPKTSVRDTNNKPYSFNARLPFLNYLHKLFARKKK